MEIDDYQNYEKAMGALSEALKYLSKAKNMSAEELEGRVALYRERIELIERFLEARALFQTDQQAAVSRCRDLLEDTKIDVAIKIGDVYGLLVEYYIATGMLILHSEVSRQYEHQGIVEICSEVSFALCSY